MALDSRNVLVVDNWGRVQREVERLTKRNLLVGVPAAETDRYAMSGSDDRATGGITNAATLYIQEKGSPAMNIPARPSLMPGVENASDRVARYMREGARAALEGRFEDADVALNRAGITAQSSVKNVIRAGIEPELSPRTLSARRKRGRTGEKPLYDTGQLVNSITYVIRDA